MPRIPREHGREDQQADGEGQVRAGPAEPCPGGRFEDQVEQRAQRQEDRVVLAQQASAPGQADPDPRDEPPGWSGLERHGQAVERQQPEEQERPVGQRERARGDAVIGRQVQPERREPSRPRAVKPCRQPGQQPGRAGKQHDKAEPQAQLGRPAPRQGHPQQFDDRNHRRVVVVAPVAVHGEQVMIRLVVAQPQARRQRQAQQPRNRDQPPECTSCCHP